MHLVHLTASSFFGGPERQMLGLAKALPSGYRSTFLSFSEECRCGAFLEQIAEAGFEGQELVNDTPKLRAALREVTAVLKLLRADLLICHGYKSNLMGRIAARRAHLPIISVSRGWTGENVKVSLYEKLDRFNLRFMDAVVAVSEGQAVKVLNAGVPAEKLTVIRNGARLEAFAAPDETYRERLEQLAFGHAKTVSINGGEPAASATGEIRARREKIIVAAGRLSPEKGFRVLVEAAAQVRQAGAGHRFVLFGDGSERGLLEQRIRELDLSEHFILAGFRDDLDQWLPWADIVVLPSFTEGLPNVALEAAAAGIPIIATRVGGTPEVVRDGLNGCLVAAGDSSALANKIMLLGNDNMLCRSMGDAGRKLMQAEFSFAAQSEAYQRLFQKLKLPNAIARAA